MGKGLTKLVAAPIGEAVKPLFKRGTTKLLKTIFPEALETTTPKFNFPNQNRWGETLEKLEDGLLESLVKKADSGAEGFSTTQNLVDSLAGGKAEPMMKFEADLTLHPDIPPTPKKKGTLRQTKSGVTTDPNLTKAQITETSKEFKRKSVPVTGLEERTKIGSLLKKGQARANSHHIFGIGDAADPVLAHPSSEGLLPGAEHPIVQYGKQNFGTISGEDPINYMTALDNLTKGTRASWIEQADEILEGLIPRQVINDIRGSSPRKGQSSVGMSASDPQASGQIQWRQEGRGKVSYDPHKYGGNIMRGEGTGAPATPLPGKNTYLIIRDPENGTDIIRAMTGKKPDQAVSPLDFQKRVRHILNYYNQFKGKKIDVEKTLQRLKKIKLDPNLDTYGVDHPHIHTILPKAPIFKKIQKMIANGSWQKLSIPKAAELWHKLCLEQRTIAENMLQYRYDLITAEYNKTPGNDFKALNIADQTKFFLDNINDLAGLGGWHRLPKMKQLIEPNPKIDREALAALFNLQSLPKKPMEQFQQLVPQPTSQPIAPQGF